MFDRLKGQNVLVTGHTGFKGSWLSLFLLKLGAKVTGLSLDPPTTPNHFDLIGLAKHMQNERVDIRDREALYKGFRTCRPNIVFHLAARPLVLESYQNPLETFDVNVQGTANVLEAIRRTPSVQAAVIITTDKVYQNDEQEKAFQESDPVGAADPYSTSKAMTELLSESYYKSFFQKQGIGLATARAGNVIGGGDFAENRLVPDCMRSLFKKESLLLRNPETKRPWMHVLDPLMGYLLLGANLLENAPKFSSPFNFGPEELVPLTCRSIIEEVISYHGAGAWHTEARDAPKEKTTLQLSSEKARELLGFKPVHSINSALCDTLRWFQGYEAGLPCLDLSLTSLEAYLEIS